MRTVDEKLVLNTLYLSEEGKTVLPSLMSRLTDPRKLFLYVCMMYSILYGFFSFINKNNWHTERIVSPKNLETEVLYFPREEILRLLSAYRVIGVGWKGTNARFTFFMEGICARALSPVLSSELWLKFMAHHLAYIHRSLQYLRGKRGKHAHTDSTAACSERILVLYELEFGWTKTNSLPLHKRRHPME